MGAPGADHAALARVFEEQCLPTRRMVLWASFYGFVGWLAFGVISYAAFRILYYVFGVIG